MAEVYITNEEYKEVINHIIEEMGVSKEQSVELVEEITDIIGVGILEKDEVEDKSEEEKKGE